MRADRRFSEQCLRQLRAAIADAGGNEVFALGRLDDKGIVRRISITARGNEGQVLAWGIEDMKEGEDPGPPPDVFIHTHPSGLLTPTDHDLAIA